jgi:hypothetical protein
VAQPDNMHSVLRLNYETLRGLASPSVAKLTHCETLVVHFARVSMADKMVTPMTVIETTLAATPRESSPTPITISNVVWLCVALFVKLVFPAANPNFESTHGNVRKWWVEIDAAGVPQRELGFDARGEPIRAGPFGRNMGYWTDSNMLFEVDKYRAVPSDEFDSAWSAFKASHPAIADEDD